MPFSGKGAREYRQMPVANARSNYIETSFMISLSQKHQKWYNMSKNTHPVQSMYSNPILSQSINFATEQPCNGPNLRCFFSCT